MRGFKAFGGEARSGAGKATHLGPKIAAITADRTAAETAPGGSVTTAMARRSESAPAPTRLVFSAPSPNANRRPIQDSDPDPFHDPDPDPDQDLGFQLGKNRMSALQDSSSSQFGPPSFLVACLNVLEIGEVDDDPGDEYSSPDSM